MKLYKNFLFYISILLFNFCHFTTTIIGFNKPSSFRAQTCPYGFFGSECLECGLQTNFPNVKIVGGQEAVPHSWPSMALIVFRYEIFIVSTGRSQSVKYLCGGTLIDQKTILTAAHCYIEKVLIDSVPILVVPNQNFSSISSMYTVYLGLHNKIEAYTGPKFDSTNAIAIESFIRHPFYDENTSLNDIAIIKLANQVTLNENIQPACLPNPSILNYPLTVWATGWGSISEGGLTPDNLHNVQMTLYDGPTCVNVNSELPKDWSKQLCAGDYLGGKDTCQGDSGGPLFMKDKVNKKEKFIIIGITSYGSGCAKPGYPGIYTKVSPYLEWIQSEMGFSFMQEQATSSSPRTYSDSEVKAISSIQPSKDFLQTKSKPSSSNSVSIFFKSNLLLIYKTLIICTFNYLT